MEIIVPTSSDIDACPVNSLAPSHYRPDGSCRCWCGDCGFEADEQGKCLRFNALGTDGLLDTGAKCPNTRPDDTPPAD